MPTTVHKEVSPGGHTTAIKALQAYTSQPVKVHVDDQMRAAEIIRLLLGAKIIELQNAANLP